MSRYLHDKATGKQRQQLSKLTSLQTKMRCRASRKEWHSVSSKVTWTKKICATFLYNRHSPSSQSLHPPPPPPSSSSSSSSSSYSSSSSSSIGTTARCGLWHVPQYHSIFFYLSPTLSIFSHLAYEDLFLLPLSILSWVFPFVSSLPVLDEDLFGHPVLLHSLQVT